MVELVYTTDLKSVAPRACGFESRSRHHFGFHRLTVRTLGFHPGNRGSIPLGSTISQRAHCSHPARAGRLESKD